MKKINEIGKCRFCVYRQDVLLFDNSGPCDEDECQHPKNTIRKFIYNDKPIKLIRKILPKFMNQTQERSPLCKNININNTCKFFKKKDD